MKKMKKYITVKNNLERIFLSQRVQNKTFQIIKEKQKLIVEYYDSFIAVNITGIITIFYFFNDTCEQPHNDFIDVTLNEKYLLRNILKGSLKKINVIIEGADGVGKSTLAQNLAVEGILTQDRAVKEITQKMREKIPDTIRINKVKQYLKEDKNRKVIFLYLSDEESLKKRIYSREVVSEFDKKAIIFQRLYLDTYYNLKNYKNLFLIDCLNKTEKDLLAEIKELI